MTRLSILILSLFLIASNLSAQDIYKDSISKNLQEAISSIGTLQWKNKIKIDEYHFVSVRSFKANGKEYADSTDFSKDSTITVEMNVTGFNYALKGSGKTPEKDIVLLFPPPPPKNKNAFAPPMLLRGNLFEEDLLEASWIITLVKVNDSKTRVTTKLTGVKSLNDENPDLKYMDITKPKSTFSFEKALIRQIKDSKTNIDAPATTPVISL